jgi:hypothetical protein
MLVTIPQVRKFALIAPIGSTAELPLRWRWLGCLPFDICRSVGNTTKGLSMTTMELEVVKSR